MINLPLCYWLSQMFDLRAPSSTDVPVLLLNQPTIKTERTQIHFLSDVLVAVASLDLKVPIGAASQTLLTRVRLRLRRRLVLVPRAFFLFLPASLRHKEAPCGRKRGIAARVTYKLPRDLPSVHVRKSVKLDSFKWQIQGRGPGGPGPPLFLDQTRKYFLEDRPPPFPQGLNPALRYLTCRRLR